MPCEDILQVTVNVDLGGRGHPIYFKKKTSRQIDFPRSFLIIIAGWWSQTVCRFW
jgi:hypothetical protein